MHGDEAYLAGVAGARRVQLVEHPQAVVDIESIGEATDPITVIAPGIAPQRIEVSADVVALWTGPSLWAVSAGGRQTVLDIGLSGIPQNPSVVGSHVLWEDWSDLVRIAHATMDDSASIFRRADPGDIKEVHTDGIELTWLEGYDRQPDRSYARLELWAAPYVSDPAALAPRFVRNMEVRSTGTMGGGWYAMLVGTPHYIDVVRLSDGTMRRWVPPAGDGVGYAPLYVSDHEILIASNRLVRIDPHTLPLVE